MTIFRHAKQLLILSSLLLCACGTLWEKDNTAPPTPLVQLKPTIRPQQLWDSRVSFNLRHDNLKLTPTVTDNNVITVDPFGTITVVDRHSGKTLWKPSLNAAISTGAAVGDNLIVVGTKNGAVIALSVLDKKEVWRGSVNSEILATPVISNHLVLIKSIDGKLTALSTRDGHFVWSYLEVEPNLILRGASTPQVARGAIIIGYASGKVVKLSLQTGHELWSQALTLPDGAFAIQRMIDIDANPIISGNQVFAVTYQGKVAALDFNSGKILWDHDVSAYAGIAVDESRVYVSDAKSYVWALDRDNGRVVWKQTQLEARNITGPALMDNYVIVGDAEGALHWLNKLDGAFAGRALFGGNGILANPVAQNNTVYAITQDGYLYAYAVH